MSHVSLYSISDQISALIESIENSGGEIDEEKEALIASTRDLLTTKTDGIVEWVFSQEDLLDQIDKRIAQMKEFRAHVENKMDKFDRYVDACLAKLGTDTIDGSLYQIKKRKPAKVVVIKDETLIPIDYIYTPPAPEAQISKTMIANVLKNGGDVPGASLEDSKNISIQYQTKKQKKK